MYAAGRSGVIFLIASIGFLSLALPLIAQAQAGASSMANPTCVACVAEATAQKVPPYPYCKPRVCVDTTNGVTKGHCEMTLCHADSFSGAGQSGNTGLDQVMKALGDLFGKLMKGGEGGGAPPPPPPPSQTGAQNCTQFFQTSDIGQMSNPCAQYVAPASNAIIGASSGGCDPLSQLLGTCGATQSTSSSGTIDANADTNTSTGPDQTNTGSSTSQGGGSTTKPSGSILMQKTSTGPMSSDFFSASNIALHAGISGDIQVTDSGATVLAGTRNTANNTEVAGFYGSETSSGQEPQGLVAGMCQSRPWANNFLSAIIPPAFFDGLCTWRGYGVGMPATSTPVVEHRQSGPKTPEPQAAVVAPTNSVAPKVDIWAVPTSVSLGARTSIFWNTQGVTNCIETSPDGSFNQNSVSGGAATVPLTGPTIFTISCEAQDGSHVSAFVKVNLSI